MAGSLGRYYVPAEICQQGGVIVRPRPGPTRRPWAIAAGRTLLTLDTAEEDGAAGLYEGLGYQYVGTIPDFALKPHGGLTGTMIYWKRIAAAPG